MKRLLQIEFIKLVTYTGFWIPAIFWALLFVLCLFLGTQISVNIPGLDSGTFFRFPALWNTTTWLASWFNLILAIISMIFICNEFSYKTFRQHVIDGLSRTELFFGKVYLMFVFAFVGFVLVVASTLILGIFYNNAETWPLIMDTIYLPFVYFIQAFAYMAFAMMIALLVKNIGLSILAFFGYFVFFEPIVRNFFPENILMFFPMKVISNLTPAPDVFQVSTNAQFTTTINGQIVDNAPAASFEMPLWGNSLVAVGYIALFLTISWYILKNKKL
jgi:ABC-type transport system involved in multi-copper enzyme maturation permease subunit